MQSRWQLLLAVVMIAGFVLALASRAAASEPSSSSVAVEALRRLKWVDLEANPSLKAAVFKVLESTRGTPQFVDLVRELNLKDQAPALLDLAKAHPDESFGVEALRLVLAQGEMALVERSLRGAGAASLVRALGNTGQKEVVPLLRKLAVDAQADPALRFESVRALAQTSEGAELLLRLAADSELSDALKPAAAAALREVRWPAVKARAMALFPAASRPTDDLPPVSELLKLRGDPARGAEVFTREAVGCSKCHQVNGAGAEIGPNLSEVGTKLGKEAIYEAILDPSGGIAFGFEAWEVELKNGDEAYGLLASQTADEITIKAPTGIVTRIRRSEVTSLIKLKTSMMPDGLAHTMSRQDLIDLVEYLASLRKKQ